MSEEHKHEWINHYNDEMEVEMWNVGGEVTIEVPVQCNDLKCEATAKAHVYSTTITIDNIKEDK
ncbi:MAG: hypothetical protein KJI71_01270 [Patescibacteria group bacterium]|nr:hypothetical protein [Patescibacteria group bacterium]